MATGLRSGSIDVGSGMLPKVYFLVMSDPREPARDLGLVKVGITRGDVAGRILSLQTGNPYDLHCFDSFDTLWANEVEHFMHRTHAKEMHKNEWLTWPRSGLASLVAEARDAARRIGERKSREQDCLSRVSNGNLRRASPGEKRLHLDARRIQKELIPARLMLEGAECRLKAATGDTYGIPGIVRVKYVVASLRLSERLARLRFPQLVSRCTHESVSGTFHWRGMPKKRQFEDYYRALTVAKQRAAESSSAVLRSMYGLEGFTGRTRELEARHDEFLKATRTVHHLAAELADLRTELIVSLDNDEALEGVCSFKRALKAKFQTDKFVRDFPGEAVECAEPVGPRLWKRVYPSRSYLAS
jgi:hypothetical protein